MEDLISQQIRLIAKAAGITAKCRTTQEPSGLVRRWAFDEPGILQTHKEPRYTDDWAVDYLLDRWSRKVLNTPINSTLRSLCEIGALRFVRYVPPGSGDKFDIELALNRFLAVGGSTTIA